MALWHARVGQEQGGGRLLKFLGEADESTEISSARHCMATPVISHVTVYYYSKLYNTSLPLVYLIEPIACNGLIKYRVLFYRLKLLYVQDIT